MHRIYWLYKNRDNLRLSTLCTDYGDNKMFKLLLWELFYSLLLYSTHPVPEEEDE